MNNCSKTEQEIWQQWQEAPGDQTRNELIEFYLCLFEKEAEMAWWRLPAVTKTQIDTDDLLTAIVIEIPRAIELYNSEKGTAPRTHLISRCRWIIKDYLRRIDWVPRSVRSSGDVIKYKVSLDNSPLQKHVDSGARYGKGDKVEDRSLQCLDSSADQIDLADQLDHLLARLSAHERQAIRLYYIEGLLMKDAGKAMGLSEGRVSQLVKSGLERIRQTMSDEEIEILRRSS